MSYSLDSEHRALGKLPEIISFVKKKKFFNEKVGGIRTLGQHRNYEKGHHYVSHLN